MPAYRAALYFITSVLLSLTQGLGMNLITANLPQIQGSLGATTNESMWLVAAYLAPNVSLSVILIKVRNQYGLRRFAELGILGFVLVAAMHLFVSDMQSALIVRFFSGIVASPMSSLAFFYMLEPLPQAKKLGLGLSLALTNTTLGAPIARLVAPGLLEIGQWHGLYLLEAGLAMMAFAGVYTLPLTAPPRAKVLHWLDFVSYIFLAIGFGLTAMGLTVGRFYWWFEAPWLGAMFACAIAALTVAVLIELNRESPFLDIRWLTSKQTLHLAGVLLLFRFALSEQTSGAYAFFQALGLQNEQLGTLAWVILAGGMAGGVACAAFLKPGREPLLHMLALCFLTIGAYMDSQATNLTRPEEMYVSQALIAAAGTLFLPPAMAAGMVSALQKGPNYILSFIVVFLATQSLGGALGSAALGTFVTWREKFHSAALVEHITLTNPVVAQRISQLSGAYGRVLTDKSLLNAEGLALLSQQATKEAYVLAYNDVFLVISVLSGVALAILAIHLAILSIGRRLSPAPQPSAG
ncbi:MFS transporter [Microvirga sp. TS319]|uniref:MFS transporter n=1 Tax=Microvirga sp. TS319 TaxID=3241165 RepID=UPI00351A0D6F